MSVGLTRWANLSESGSKSIWAGHECLCRTFVVGPRCAAVFSWKALSSYSLVTARLTCFLNSKLGENDKVGWSESSWILSVCSSNSLSAECLKSWPLCVRSLKSFQVVHTSACFVPNFVFYDLVGTAPRTVGVKPGPDDPKWLSMEIHHPWATYGPGAKGGLWATSIWPPRFLIENNFFLINYEILHFINEI